MIRICVRTLVFSRGCEVAAGKTGGCCECLGASLFITAGSLCDSAAALTQDSLLLRECKMFPLLTWHFSLLMQGVYIVLFSKRGAHPLCSAPICGVAGKLFMPPFSDLRLKEFSSTAFLVAQKSQQDELTPKLLGIMKEDRCAPERLDVELKVPYASHLQICIFHSRLNRSSLV